MIAPSHVILTEEWMEEEAYLEASGTSAVEIFRQNSKRLKAVNYFCKKAPS